MGDAIPFRAGRRRRAQRRRLLRGSLGDVLRRARLEQGRTLADVARAARVSMPYLSELERGRKEASSEVLAAICDALHVELPDVLTAVGRDLIAHNAENAVVFRLEAFHDARSSQGPGPGDARCALAA